MKENMNVKNWVVEIGFSEETANRYYAHLKSGKFDDTDKEIKIKLDDYLLEKGRNEIKNCIEQRSWNILVDAPPKIAGRQPKQMEHGKK